MQSVEYYLALKIIDVLLCSPAGMNPKDIMLSERSWAQTANILCNSTSVRLGVECSLSGAGGIEGVESVQRV